MLAGTAPMRGSFAAHALPRAGACTPYPGDPRPPDAATLAPHSRANAAKGPGPGMRGAEPAGTEGEIEPPSGPRPPTGPDASHDTSRHDHSSSRAR